LDINEAYGIGEGLIRLTRPQKSPSTKVVLIPCHHQQTEGSQKRAIPLGWSKERRRADKSVQINTGKGLCLSSF
jgi:hypothetical protein